MTAAHSVATGTTETGHGVSVAEDPHCRAGRKKAIGVLLGVVASTLTVVTHAAQCVLERLAELPVTMSGTRPIVHAKINGADAAFLADSGAFYSLLTPAAAAEYKLPLRYSKIDVSGVGGAAQTWVGEGIAGVIGQNVFRIADVEYDLANGMIRLIRPKDCKNAALAYWAIAESKPFSEIDAALQTQPKFAIALYGRGVAKLRNGESAAGKADISSAKAMEPAVADQAARSGITP
jgi:Aspartyl protease